MGSIVTTELQLDRTLCLLPLSPPFLPSSFSSPRWPIPALRWLWASSGSPPSPSRLLGDPALHPLWCRLHLHHNLPESGTGNLSQSSGHLGMEGNLGFCTVASVTQGFQVARIPAPHEVTRRPRGPFLSNPVRHHCTGTAHNLKSASHARPRATLPRSLADCCFPPTQPLSCGRAPGPPLPHPGYLGTRRSVLCGAGCAYTTIFQRAGRET